jgi:iron complex outermembrane recepter protein
MKISLSLWLAVLSTAVFAQSSITGTITDTANQPLEFVNVVLYRTADSVMSKAAATNASGKYTFEGISGGDYYVHASFIGLVDTTITPFHLNEGSSLVLDAIAMRSAANETNAVEIVYTKPLVQVEADKTIFNVEGTINSAGLDALELLRKAPGVMVDNNNNISVKGRTGIQVYIDGKLSPLDEAGLAAMLKGMQSNNIESIEIITNPSAKYDAAGGAGIINIKLKKNKNHGTNGNVQLGYAIQKFGKYNGSFNINKRNAKFNLFGMYSNFQGKSWNWMDLDRMQVGNRYDQRTNTYNKNNDHNFKAGVDHYINDKQTIGVMVSGNLGLGKSDNDSYALISPLNSDTWDSELYARNINESTRVNINANVNYQFADTLGHTFTMDLDYGTYAIDNTSDQFNTYRYNSDNAPNHIDYVNDTQVDIDISSVKGDYEQKLWKGKLGAGFKWSQVGTKNDYAFYDSYMGIELLDSLRSNLFDYNEAIYAGYVNYKKQFSRVGIQTGIRAEQTDSEGNLISYVVLSDEDRRNVRRSYLNFFPSAALTYNVNDTNQFTLTYSRRIDRPSYQDLNPFEYKLDELSYQAGNPFLQPQYSNVMELTYTYMYGTNASLVYSYTEDYMTNVLDTANTQASFITMRNMGHETWVGINLSSPIPLSKKLNLFVNLNAGYKKIEGTLDGGRTVGVEIWSYSGFGQLTYKLPYAITFEASGWYSGPSVWGATFVNRSMGSLDIAAKKEFWNGAANLRLALSDVLYSNHWSSRSDSNGIDMRARGGWESRQFRVSFGYNFGNRYMKKTNRKSGADDLNSRVK